MAPLEPEIPMMILFVIRPQKLGDILPARYRGPSSPVRFGLRERVTPSASRDEPMIQPSVYRRQRES